MKLQPGLADEQGANQQALSQLVKCGDEYDSFKHHR
jgi:hypothetical protein